MLARSLRRSGYVLPGQAWVYPHDASDISDWNNLYLNNTIVELSVSDFRTIGSSGPGGVGAQVNLTPGRSYTFTVTGVTGSGATARQLRAGSSLGGTDYAAGSSIASGSWIGTHTLTFTPTASPVWITIYQDDNPGYTKFRDPSALLT